MHFMHFCEWQLQSDSNFTKVYYFGSGNDMAPESCQAITWTNVDKVP